ncbi:MAG: biotin transporter BioY [Ruminococcaceae bacterium]|nr:biotin transporter BioY [Oscillospiraceae bacterium]
MRTRKNTVTALLAAALCVMAPLAVPLGPVPVTLATLGVYLAAGLMGPWRGLAAVGLYLALGGIGLPVFAGFAGGLQQLTGPTGGFLWGYLLCALLAGLLCRTGAKPLTPVWLLCGAAVLYAAGCGWFAWQTDTPLWSAVVLCAAPCLPGECIKIALATGLILSLRGRVERVLTHGVKAQRL